MVDSVNGNNYGNVGNIAPQYNTSVKTAVAQPKVQNEPAVDTVEISKPAKSDVSNEDSQAKTQTQPDEMSADKAQQSEQTQEKRSSSQKAKDAFNGVRKGLITGSEFCKGIIKGTIKAVIGAGVVLGVVAYKNFSKGAPKLIPTKWKVVAGLVAAGGMGDSLYSAYVNSSEKRAKIDRRHKPKSEPIQTEKS